MAEAISEERLTEIETVAAQFNDTPMLEACKEIRRLREIDNERMRFILEKGIEMGGVLKQNAALKKLLDVVKRTHASPSERGCDICQAIAEAEEVCGGSDYGV